MRLSFLAIFMVAFFMPSFALAVDASSAVQESVNQILSKTSDPEALSRNLQEPLLTDVPLITLDGSKSGPAQIACPGTKTVFQILIQPSPTNDLQFVSIAYDTDYDGKLDRNLDISIPVSGVCANGFVSCTPGTWQDCHWYTWKYDEGTLSYEEVSPSSLGGCYCINNGCTEAPFLTMKNQILKDLGGGVAGAMAAGDPKLSVSEAEIEDFVIRYYGQTSGDCTLPKDYIPSGSSSPESIFEDQAELEIAKEQELTDQKSNPDSLYNLITNSSAFTQASTQTCIIQHTVSVITEEKYRGSDCIVPSCESLDFPHGECQSIPVFNYYNVLVDDDYYAETDCNPLCLDGTCVDDATEVDDVPSCGEYIGTKLSKGWGRHKKDGWDDCHHKKYFQYKVNDSHIIYDRFQLGASNSCTEFEQDPDCYLKEERICDVSGKNCIVTYQNYNPTGVVPLQQCIQLNGLKTYEACVNGGELSIDGTIYTTGENIWWRVERTYVCTDKPLEEPDLSRADAIAESLTSADDSWTYQDPVYGEGNIQFENKNGESCIKACKLQVVEQRSQASATYTTADYRNNPPSQFYIYRTCVDGTCPVKEGEKIVEDCKCLDEFGTAYGVLESLRQASVDMICSDGTAKP